MFALYAHNDWRVRNNLTLNLGLRWEYESPLTEADDRMISGFDFDTPLPIAAHGPGELRAQSDSRKCPCPRSRCAAACSTRTPAAPRRRGSGVYGNFMPRAGFSWQPQQKTAVRGGYGLFYDVLGPNRISANQTGYSRSTALTAVARQRPDVRCDARQPVPERAARTGRQRARADDERRPRRRPSRTTATSALRARTAGRSACSASCRGPSWSRAPTSARSPRTSRSRAS